MQWPVRSPDLNPIENMWAIMKQKLRKHPALPSNPEHLFSILCEIWYSMPDSYFHSLVASMPNRVKFVKSHKGGLTIVKLVEIQIKLLRSGENHDVAKHWLLIYILELCQGTVEGIPKTKQLTLRQSQVGARVLQIHIPCSQPQILVRLLYPSVHQVKKTKNRSFYRVKRLF